MAKVLDCLMEVSPFELQSCYYVHSNIIEKRYKSQVGDRSRENPKTFYAIATATRCSGGGTFLFSLDCTSYLMLGKE